MGSLLIGVPETIVQITKPAVPPDTKQHKHSEDESFRESKFKSVKLQTKKIVAVINNMCLKSNKTLTGQIYVQQTKSV